VSEPTTAQSLWRLRDVRIVVPARAVSLLGDSVLAIILLLYLQHARIGVWPVALMLAVESLPLVLLIGIAGRVADTYDSRTTLITATAVQAAACAALAFTSAIAGVFLLVLLIQVGQAFTSPTWTALMPRVVGEERIGRFVALQSGIAALAGPLGAGLGGLLFGLAGPRTAILLDAATFTALLGAAAAVKTRRNADSARPAEPAKSAGPDAPESQQRTVARTISNALADVSAGFLVLRRDAIVWPMMWALAAVLVVTGGANVVDVFLVRISLHTSASWYGMSEIIAAVGAVAGAAIAARATSVNMRLIVNFTGYLVIGLGCIGAGLSPVFVVYLCFACLIGLANSAANTTFGAVLIERTPETHRGKAAATLNGVAQVAIVLGLVLGGTAGQVFGPRTTFVMAGVAGVAVSLCCAALAVRQRRLGTWQVSSITPDGQEQSESVT
jgi:MFS family permease